MASFEEKLKKFAVDIFHIQGVKFGNFTLKLGIQSPIYFDLRVIVSHPQLMNDLSDLIIEFSKSKSLKYEILCGVPYTALPIATVMSVKTNVPMVIRRKEAKGYGTKKLIEGNFKEGCECLIIEDVVTTGSSILETVRDLKNAGIKCKDVVVLLNRQQGGEEILNSQNIKMHSILSMEKLLKYLKEENCIKDSVVSNVMEYIRSSQHTSQVLKNENTLNRLKMTYEERISFCNNVLSEKLLKIIVKKKTNLCLAADVTKSQDLLNLANLCGPHICLFKTHVDIIEDFSQNFIDELQKLAKTHNFILFEDRKFSDIGKTVQLQFTKGVYQISSWAELVTVHSLTGKGVLDGIKQSSSTDKGIFILAETSAIGNLIDDNYKKGTLNLATDYSDLITGVVCQSPLFLESPGLIQLTPGVQLVNTGDDLGQQYNSPENVILNHGADIAVVGRGITQSQEPGVVAEQYKALLWKAYLQRTA